MSADPVFARLWPNLLTTLHELRYDHFAFLLWFAAGWLYCFGCLARCPRLAAALTDTAAERPRADVVISATFLALLNLLFFSFSVIQAAYLFNGGFMNLPEGLVYAQYAREGFFQLLGVTVINFLVLIVFLGWLEGGPENALLRGLLVGLCLFTGVLIASSFYRMSLYIDAYGYTPLRLRVLTFLTLEVFLTALTVGRLFSDRVKFARGFWLTGFVFYLLANVTGGDYFATRLNINLFLEDRLPYIDVKSADMDGLYLLRPLLEDDRYVRQNGKIKKKSIPTESSDQEFYDMVSLNKLQSLKDGPWQNGSYFKYKFLKSVDIEQYARTRAAREERIALEKAERRAAEQKEEAAQRQAEQQKEAKRINKARLETLKTAGCALPNLDIPQNSISYGVTAAARSKKSGWLAGQLAALYGHTKDWNEWRIDQHGGIPPNAKIYAATASPVEKSDWLVEQAPTAYENKKEPLTAATGPSDQLAGLIQVVVNSPQNPVFLILENVVGPNLWEIKWTEGSRVAAVLVVGSHSQFITGLPPDIQVLNNSLDANAPCGAITDADSIMAGDLSMELFGYRRKRRLISPNDLVVVGPPPGANEKLFTAQVFDLR
jgi:hypothetical protein